MTDLPDVKLRGLVNFPVRVTGGPGIGITKANGLYTVGMDVSDLVQNDNISAGQVAQSRMTIWNSATNSYQTVPFALAATAGVASIHSKTGALDIGKGLQFTGDTLELDAGTDGLYFENIAAARAYSIISTVSYFRTAGRATAGDGGASLYLRLGSVPSPVKAWHEQTADGAYWILSPLPYLKPQQFDNGIPNVSTDCGPALRNCRDYILALGKGVIDFGQKSDVFLVGTLRSQAILEPVSNLRMQGGFIKVADGVYSGSTIAAFFQTDFFTGVADNFEMVGVTVDYNGDNNINSGYCAGVAIGGGIDPVIEGNTFLNFPGSQPLVIGDNSSIPRIVGGRICGNVFKRMGYDVNPATSDLSSIYFNAVDLICTENNMKNSGDRLAVTTGIEAHGTGWTVANNIVDGYQRHGNIAADCSNCVGGDYSHNIGRNLRIGVVGFSVAPFVMDRISVASNQFELISQDILATIDFVSQMDLTSILGILDILDNQITDAEADGVAASIYAGVSAAGFSVLRVRGNVMKSLSGPGIDMGNLSNNTHLEIIDNTVIDCGRTSDANYKKGIKVLIASTPKTVKIGRNTVSNTAIAYMTHGVHVGLTSVAGGMIYKDDVIVNVATPYTISAPGATIGPGL